MLLQTVNRNHRAKSATPLDPAILRGAVGSRSGEALRPQYRAPVSFFISLNGRGGVTPPARSGPTTKGHIKMLHLTTKDYAGGVRHSLKDALYENDKLRGAVNTMLQALAVISDRIVAQNITLNTALARNEEIIKRNTLLTPETETEEGGEE